jgi:hypothetical protein
VPRDQGADDLLAEHTDAVAATAVDAEVVTAFLDLALEVGAAGRAR